jgi:hypothetical protein
VPSADINQYWSVKTTSPENLSGINFFDYDVVILSGVPSLSENYVRRLKAFVQMGKSLLLTYNGSTDVDYFNATWSNASGVIYDEPVKQNFSRAGYYTLKSLNLDHPIFSVFAFEKNRLPEIKFFTLPRLHLNGEAKPLATFSGDRPALVETRFGAGRILTFTGPISPVYSDLTSHAFFVPFISRAAEYLAADLSSYDVRLFVGEKITRSITVRGTVQSALEMIAPDSSVYSLPPEEGNNSIVVRVHPSNLPGIYRISYLGKEIDRFAVNIDPVEGNLDEVDSHEFATSIGANDLHHVKTGSNLASAIAETRFGKELWPLFMWAAVLFIFLEILLSRSAPPEG